jgi:dTMP kinase
LENFQHANNIPQQNRVIIMKGKFITFEGSEGSGKSTQSKLLCRYLKNKGYEVIFLREPGGTKISEKIRQILLDNKNAGMSQESEMLLYMAARAQVAKEVIVPALRAGTIVVCDRFLDSTLAYQGYGLGMDIRTINYIGSLVTYGVKPDLTIFLDLPIKRGLRHRKFKEDRIEKRALSYHMRVRRGYLALAKAEPRRIKIVKVDRDKQKTQSDIRMLVEAYVI